MQVNAIDIFRALSELARRYQFRSRDEVCCYGLTVSQCYALQALYWEGSLTGSDVAERLGLDLSTTTRVIDQLVKKKLASRSHSESDRRVRDMEITEAGRRLVQRLEEEFAQSLVPVMDEFSAEVKKEAPRLLRRLAQVLGKKGALCAAPVKVTASGRA